VRWEVLKLMQDDENECDLGTSLAIQLVFQESSVVGL
jgi:hypothetical protein